MLTFILKSDPIWVKNIEKMRLFDMGLYRDGAYNLDLFQWDEFDGADYGAEFQARFQIET